MAKVFDLVAAKKQNNRSWFKYVLENASHGMFLSIPDRF